MRQLLSIHESNGHASPICFFFPFFEGRNHGEMRLQFCRVMIWMHIHPNCVGIYFLKKIRYPDNLNKRLLWREHRNPISQIERWGFVVLGLQIQRCEERVSKHQMSIFHHCPENLSL